MRIALNSTLERSLHLPLLGYRHQGPIDLLVCCHSKNVWARLKHARGFGKLGFWAVGFSSTTNQHIIYVQVEHSGTWLTSRTWSSRLHSEEDKLFHINSSH